MGGPVGRGAETMSAGDGGKGGTRAVGVSVRCGGAVTTGGGLAGKEGYMSVVIFLNLYLQ